MTREAPVGESVSLFVASPSLILFVRKEGLGDVEACLVVEPRHPVSCMQVISSEVSEPHSSGFE
jgi:alpha-D-ribose 1-methylphosphonate 5-triphosphate synthase subunit PhnL